MGAGKSLPVPHAAAPISAGRRQLGLGPSLHGGVLRAPHRVGPAADREGGPRGTVRTHLSPWGTADLSAPSNLRFGLLKRLEA